MMVMRLARAFIDEVFNFIPMGDCTSFQTDNQVVFSRQGESMDFGPNDMLA